MSDKVTFVVLVFFQSFALRTFIAYKDFPYIISLFSFIDVVLETIIKDPASTHQEYPVIGSQRIADEMIFLICANLLSTVDKLK